MKLSAEQIKQAILHPENEVRLTAVSYFADSFSDDPTVMPFVIRAVEQYGMDKAFRLLRHSEWLRQTPATVDWIISQLRCDFDTADIEQDNQRYALAVVLTHAEPELLAHRHGEILSLAAFPESFKEPLGECLKMEFSDWSALWSMFEEVGQQTMDRESMSRTERRRFERLLRAMARHPGADSERVLALLRYDYQGHDEDLMSWMEPLIIELAGRLRIPEAVPLILDELDSEEDSVLDEISTALIRIGGDEAANAIIEKWTVATTESRYILAEALGHIHTEAAHKHLLNCLVQRDDFDLEVFIANILQSHLSSDAVLVARQLLLEYDEEDMDAELWDVRYHVIAAATLIGETFPEYEAWHEEAVATNYGWTDVIKDEPRRLADAFNDESSRPSRQIEAHPSTVYQLKITLKDIKPPIWRRLIVPDCSLDDLHEIIQISMGWEGTHLYSFKIGDTEFTHPEMDDGELNMEDSTDISLSEVILKEKQKLRYSYDFGDGWQHEIVVEKIGKPETGQQYPQCLKGNRACPPEDVGGPWGYASYLEAISDPDHEQHEEFLGWRGEFDPEAFDLDSVNDQLRQVFGVR